jgi:uncharacterized protein YqjF (DUF2071 family)
MLPWILDMWWRDVCFMHWRADAALVARALPAGVDLERYNGDAWLSVVPFQMTAVRLRGGPVFPGFSRVLELNLRTYVRVGARRGVWFFSLDAASPLAVRAARLMTALPYFDACMSTSERDGSIAFASRRTSRSTVDGRFQARYTPTGDARPAEPGSLSAFLHERYRFFSRRGTRLLAAEVRHEPWLLQPASVEIAENSLGTIIGASLTAIPEYVAFGRALRVRATATERASS